MLRAVRKILWKIIGWCARKPSEILSHEIGLASWRLTFRCFYMTVLVFSVFFFVLLVAAIFNSKRKHRGNHVPESIESFQTRSQRSLDDCKNYTISALFEITFEAFIKTIHGNKKKKIQK